MKKNTSESENVTIEDREVYLTDGIFESDAEVILCVYLRVCA